MSDLRQFAAELIANPLVPVPPLEGVVARARHYRAARRRRQIGAGLCLVAMTMMAVARAGVGVGDRDSLRMVGNPNADESSVGSTTPSIPGLGPDSTTFPTLPWSGQSFDGDWTTVRQQRDCATILPPKPEIKVLAHDPSIGNGPGKAVEQVVEGINHSGGICGRHIKLSHGNANTSDLGEYVAVLGLPFDNGLDAAIANGRIAKANIPVVAGDGLPEVQHRSPWVYPVGPSAAAMTRTATAHAIAKGAKSFAIVYDAEHTFGRESARSFDRYVRHRGGDLKAAIPLDPSANAYAPQADRLTSACGVEQCDFVLLALLPETAQKWLVSNPVKPRMQLAGLSTVLADGFTDHCLAASKASCDGLVAWSGYVPRTPVQWWNEQAKAAYGPADAGSATREGAVIAAWVLGEALGMAGPDVTRSSLRKALDSITYTSHIAAPLSWPGTRVSQAWVLRTDGIVPEVHWDRDIDRAAQAPGPIPGPQWHPGGTGWVRDPG